MSSIMWEQRQKNKHHIQFLGILTWHNYEDMVSSTCSRLFHCLQNFVLSFAAPIATSGFLLAQPTNIFPGPAPHQADPISRFNILCDHKDCFIVHWHKGANEDCRILKQELSNSLMFHFVIFMFFLQLLARAFVFFPRQKHFLLWILILLIIWSILFTSTKTMRELKNLSHEEGLSELRLQPGEEKACVCVISAMFLNVCWWGYRRVKKT